MQHVIWKHKRRVLSHASHETLDSYSSGQRGLFAKQLGRNCCTGSNPVLSVWRVTLMVRD